MNRLPRLASELLDRFGVEPALVGDLEESACAGRSRVWCWRQVAGALWLSSYRVGVTRPIYTLRGIAVGWGTLLGTFALIDYVPIFTRLRMAGYETGEWAAFWLAGLVLSYSGFALSAWATARFHRHTPGLLVLHTTTVLISLTVSALWVASSNGPVALPHFLFPLVSVALPYQVRSGLVFAPTVMLLTGALVLRRTSDSTAR